VRVISGAPVIAHAIAKFLADGSLDEGYEEAGESTQVRGVMTHDATILS
jgi:hypothetical protein